MKHLVLKVVFVVAIVAMGLVFRGTLAPTLSAQAAIVQLNNSVDSTAASKTLMGLINGLPVFLGLLSMLVFVPDVKKAFAKKSDSKGETISA